MGPSKLYLESGAYWKWSLMYGYSYNCTSTRRTHVIAEARVHLRQVVEILERGRLTEREAVRDARREQERAHEVRRRARLARVRAQRERVQPVPCAQSVQHHQVRVSVAHESRECIQFKTLRRCTVFNCTLVSIRVQKRIRTSRRGSSWRAGSCAISTRLATDSAHRTRPLLAETPRPHSRSRSRAPGTRKVLYTIQCANFDLKN